MKICSNCYKQLERQMFSPYDYIFDKDLGHFTSTCCRKKIMKIDGRQYYKVVKQSKEKRQLEYWKEHKTLAGFKI